MIGLGSNRLSVCRRGGMSVTQAGRGGLEWLAGGRRPDWITPYSAQATAALKDAFTATKWPTIRDYGFAHPALVPFINEDPMLVMSLIEGLGLREMYSDGNAYIALLISVNSLTSDSKVGYRLRNASYTGGKTAMFGSKVGWQSNDLSISLGAWNNNGNAYIGYGGSYTDSWAYTKDNKPHSIRLANKNAYFDGVLKKTYSPSSFTTRPLLLYRVSGGGGDGQGLDSNTSILYARIKDTGLDLWVAPFKLGVARTVDKVSTGVAQAAGTCGMIDLLTGIFYPNANSSGSFTISETPAS